MDISIKDFLQLLAKNFVIIILCCVIGLIGSFLIFSFAVKPTYVSSVKLYVYTVGESENPQGYDNLNDLNYAQKIVNTYIEMLRTDSFYKSVKDKTSLDYSLDDLKNMISFTVLNDTEVFQISVSSHKPEDSKMLADTITQLAPKTISAIKESAQLKVVDSASFPTKPASPNIFLDSAVGFLLGLVVSIVYVLLKEVLDIRIKQESDLSARYTIPVLGSIPAFGSQSLGNVIFEKGEDS